jgi:hypothetical protein
VAVCPDGGKRRTHIERSALANGASAARAALPQAASDSRALCSLHPGTSASPRSPLPEWRDSRRGIPSLEYSNTSGMVARRRRDGRDTCT